MQRPLPGFRVAGRFVIRDARGQPHKPDIMMQAVKFFKTPVQLGFGNLRDFLVFLVAGFMVHHPQHACPKAVGPPVNAVRIISRRIIYGPVVMHTVHGRIRNFVPGALADRVHFGRHFGDNAVQPLPLCIV